MKICVQLGSDQVIQTHRLRHELGFLGRLELEHQLGQKHGVLRLKFLQTLRHGLVFFHLTAEGHRGLT